MKTNFGRNLFLIYKIVRAPLGLSFAFVLMYGAFIGNFSLSLLLAAFGLFLIELFAAIYNDYCDYKEDIRNKRTDKIILAGLLSRNQMRNVSFLIAVFALVSLWFSSFFMFLFGIFCLAVSASYSNPGVRLKGSLNGYLMAATITLPIPFVVNTVFQRPFSIQTLVFSLFFYFQVVYILCQKDSTDLKDKKNLFLSEGWKSASHLAILFGSLTSVLFLLIIFSSSIAASFILLFFGILVWLFNFSAKYYNLREIYIGKITRKVRHVLILFEFLTPYFFISLVFWGVLL